MKGVMDHIHIKNGEEVLDFECAQCIERITRAVAAVEVLPHERVIKIMKERRAFAVILKTILEYLPRDMWLTGTAASDWSEENLGSARRLVKYCSILSGEKIDLKKGSDAP